MFDELFSYDPSSISPEQRKEMAKILAARSELMRYSAEIADLRARTWLGEEGLTGITELKAADLAALRMDLMGLMRSFLAEAVDVDKLVELIPVVAMAALQSLNVPLPVFVEALGLDVDNVKMIANQIKELLSENF